MVKGLRCWGAARRALTPYYQKTYSEKIFTYLAQPMITKSFLLAEKKPILFVGIKGLKCSSIGGVFHWGGKSAKKLLSFNSLPRNNF